MECFSRSARSGLLSQSYFVADNGQEVAILEGGGHGRHSDRGTPFLIRNYHMDIFNRPPAISEDAVQYRLYPAQRSSDKVSVLTLATVLKNYADDLLPGFLWHRDPFELKVASDADGWWLEGIMRVGDCIDDEWCVVWLLREISKKWDVAIRSVLPTSLISPIQSLPQRVGLGRRVSPHRSS
jgi:hypothetical protein